MRQLAKYSFANAKIRAMLSYLLEPAVFSLLLETKDVYELVEALKKTPYKEIVETFDQDKPDLNGLEKKILKQLMHASLQLRTGETGVLSLKSGQDILVLKLRH